MDLSDVTKGTHTFPQIPDHLSPIFDFLATSLKPGVFVLWGWNMLLAQDGQAFSLLIHRTKLPPELKIINDGVQSVNSESVLFPCVGCYLLPSFFFFF